MFHSHLLQPSFISGYNYWTKRGERGVIIKDNNGEEEDDDNYARFPEYDGIKWGNLKKRQ